MFGVINFIRTQTRGCWKFLNNEVELLGEFDPLQMTEPHKVNFTIHSNISCCMLHQLFPQSSAVKCWHILAHSKLTPFKGELRIHYVFRDYFETAFLWLLFLGWCLIFIVEGTFLCLCEQSLTCCLFVCCGSAKSASYCSLRNLNGEKACLCLE